MDVVVEAAILVNIAMHCKILTEDREKIREIGERLNAAGGIETMQSTMFIVSNCYPNGDGRENGWHPTEIAAAWDGIGDWK